MSIYKTIGFVISLLSVQQGYFQDWISLDGGLVCEDFPFGIVEDLDISPVNELIVCGSIFSDNYCEEVKSVSIWQGSSWNHLGQGSENAIYLSLTTFQDKIYSSNLFEGTDKSSIGCWNGSSWDTIPLGPDNFSIYKLEVHDGELFFGGGFNSCGGVETSMIGKYNGDIVIPLLDNLDISTEICKSFEFFQDTLYIGGTIRDTNRGINALAKVFQYDIQKASDIFVPSALVTSLEVHENELWIGGSFPASEGGLIEPSTLLVYDGVSFFPAPFQPNGLVTTLKSYNGHIYIGGAFDNVDGEECHGVGRFNDFGFECLNIDTFYKPFSDVPVSTFSNTVKDIEIINDSLFIGGRFGRIGNNYNLNNVAKLNRKLSREQDVSLSSDISVYPNPVNEVLYIETGTYFSLDADYFIYDSSGRTVASGVWEAGLKRKNISVESLSIGMYLLSIESKMEVINIRFVRE